MEVPVLDPDWPYFLFTREERHFAAVLFHLLCLPGNAQALLDAFGTGWTFDDTEGGVYFEYSYLRDRWHTLGQDGTPMDATNQARCAMLSAVLRGFGASGSLLARVAGDGVAALNGRFIAKPSITQVQSPANWQVARFAAAGGSLSSPDIAAAARTKWAFRIKPDLLVQPRLGRALCLELKFGSGEGSYPAKGTERALLRPHMTEPVRQTELQRDMLGLVFGAGNLCCGFITRNGSADADGLRRRPWPEVLRRLHRPAGMPRFLRDALRLCEAGPPSV